MVRGPLCQWHTYFCAQLLQDGWLYAHLVVAHRLKAAEGRGNSDALQTRRRGIFNNLKRDLKNPDLLPLLKDVVFTTRTASRLAFAMIWQCMIDYLNLQNEACAAKLLTTHYLQQEQDGFETPWRVSPDRCLPGSVAVRNAKNHGTELA